MKKLLVLATMMLGAVSCMNELPFEGGFTGEEVKVVLTAALPNDATRAVGANSATGAIGNIDLVDTYDVRYILEVYDGENNLAKQQIKEYEDEATETQFELRLVPGRDYRFVVWADFVLEGSEEPLHYDASDLKAVKLLGNHNAMDESRDAYTAVETIVNFNSSSEIKLTLTRPFAKLRVVTNDMNELYSDIVSAEVEYASGIYTSFNALTKSVDRESIVRNVSKSVDYSTMVYTNEPEPRVNGVQTLFADYFFGAENEMALFTLKVKDATGIDIPAIHFNTDIPVKRNHLTTIYGPIMTDFNEVTVSIESGFENESQVDVWDGVSVSEPAFDSETNTYTVKNGAELAWLAAAVNGTLDGTRAAANTFEGKTFKLACDIHLGREAWTPIGASGKFEGVFDGAGYTVANFVVVSEGKSAAGLFDNAKYVRNLKVRNADIYGHYKAGVIVGNGLCSRIDNCHVEDATVTIVPLNNDDANHAGGIVGYLSAENTAYVKNCSVKNATISAYRDVAAIAGTANQAAVVSGNTVENVTVIANQTVNYVEKKAANVSLFVGRLTAKATMENNAAVDSDAYVLVNTLENINYQLSNATRDIKVLFDADFVGNVAIAQKEGVNVVVDGNGKAFDGVITVNGNARATGAETLAIQNINFATEGSDFTFISAPSKVDGKYNYSHNVTIENCTFAANQTVGCASFTGTYNFNMKSCTANNVHSIAQLQSVDNNVTIEGVTVTNSKNGISFGNTKAAVLKNSTIEALGYGVRADGAKERATTIAIENSSISAFIPVSVRKMNNDAVNVTVAFAGVNNLVRAEASAWDVAFCYNEYEEGVEPVEALGVCEVTGGDAFKVYPRDTATRVSSLEAFDDFKSANSSGDPIYCLETGNYKFTDDVTFDGRIDIQPGNDVVIDLNGQELASEADYFFIVREGATLVIDGDGVVNADSDQIVFYPAGNLTINGGTFVISNNTGDGQMFVGTKPSGGWESTGVIINGGYFDSGFYNADAANVEELIAGTMTLEETEADIKKRGVSGDKNKVRVALKENVQNALNRSNNYFKIYGGTFVGVNPAWGDEGCMLPTSPNYLRPWSYYQGALLDGQTFHEDGIVLPEGYEITKSTHEDGRPIYTVTYNK